MYILSHLPTWKPESLQNINSQVMIAESRTGTKVPLMLSLCSKRMYSRYLKHILNCRTVTTCYKVMYILSHLLPIWEPECHRTFARNRGGNVRLPSVVPVVTSSYAIFLYMTYFSRFVYVKVYVWCHTCNNVVQAFMWLFYTVLNIWCKNLTLRLKSCNMWHF